MATPITSTQIAEKSILDLFGRQTYLGNSFTLPQDGKSLASTAETAVAYLKNPAGSGKALFVFSRRVSSDNNPVQVRFYTGPTENVIGAVTAPVNLRTGFAANASVSRCYLAATFSANGTLVTTYPATVYGLATDGLIVVDPGTSLLATGKQIGVGTSSVYVELAWYEI